MGSFKTVNFQLLGGIDIIKMILSYRHIPSVCRSIMNTNIYPHKFQVSKS